MASLGVRSPWPSASVRALVFLGPVVRSRLFAHVADLHLLAVVGAEHDDDGGRLFRRRSFVLIFRGQSWISSRTKPDEPLVRSTILMPGSAQRRLSRPSASPAAMKSPTTRTVRASARFSTTGTSGRLGTARRCAVGARFLASPGLGAAGCLGVAARAARSCAEKNRSRNDAARACTVPAPWPAREGAALDGKIDMPARTAATSHGYAQPSQSPRSRHPEIARTRSCARQLHSPCASKGCATLLYRCLSRCQHFHARMAVLRQARLRLKRLDRRSSSRRRSCRRTCRHNSRCVGQPLLQLLLFLEGELGEGPVPVLHQAAVAGDLVGKKADGERVFVGVVVGLDDEEILGHQEGRAAAAVRHLQLGLVAAVLERLAVGARRRRAPAIATATSSRSGICLPAGSATS